jgi:hypothetical protein
MVFFAALELGLPLNPSFRRLDRAQQTIELPSYLNLAVDNGVKSAETSEIITHLAFYSGWANAMSLSQRMHSPSTRSGLISCRRPQ